MNTLATYLKTHCEVDVPLLLDDLTDKTRFKETLDVRACKYVASLAFTQFREHFCTGKWKDDQAGAFATDVKVYQRRISAMCRRLVSKEGLHHPNYKYGNGSTWGRLYVEGGGLQCLSKPLRCLLSTPAMIDYDIVNCHPAIMLWICNAIGKLKTPYLDEYVNNREKVMADTGKDKMEILKMLNKDYNNPKGECTWGQGFIHELKLNKQFVYDIIKDDYTTTNTKNPISSTINKLWCEIENRCIQTAIQTFLTDEDSCSPQFDGFQTNKKIEISALNELTADLELEWKVKEWTKTEVPADFDESTFRSLECMICRLNEKFFVVHEPEFAIWQENSEGAKPIAQQSFMNASREYWFKNADGKKRPIASEWFDSESKRAYDKTDYMAYAKHQPPMLPDGIYNTSKPFNFTYVAKDARDATALPLFQKLLVELSEDNSGVSYITHYISHMIQRPTVKPPVIVMFKSHGGTGKDTLTITITRMLGDAHCLVVDNMKHLFGDFNGALSNRLFVTMNEASGKEGTKYIERLKNQMTAEHLFIRHLNKDGYTQRNVFRPFVFSNNDNPFPLDSAVARRMFMNQVRADRQLQPEFFDEYYRCLDDDHWVNSLASELWDLDLSAFNIRKPPVTKSMHQKLQAKIPPICRLFQDLCEGKHTDKVHTKVPKMTGCIAIKTRDFQALYREYLAEKFPTGHDLFYTEPKYFSDFCGKYNDIIYANTRKSINGKQTRVHVIHPERMLKGLKNHKQYTEPEVELESSDIELESGECWDESDSDGDTDTF